MKFKNVIVPVDFSQPSILAVNYGISFARKCRAKLTLLHVLESPTALTVRMPMETANLEKEHREHTLRMLSSLVASEDQDDLDLRIIIKSGDIKKEIVSTIAQQHDDIVVMGTHGRGLLGRLLIGSITQGMLRKLSIPVLTVCHAIRPLRFERILFATDLSEPSKKGFRFALDMAQMMCSDVVLFHTVERGVSFSVAEAPGYVDEYSIDEARVRLGEFVAEANCQSVKVERVIVEGIAADEILKAAEDNTADLVLISVQRRGFVERALLGTTAERVIREANIPVLSIPTDIVLDQDEIVARHSTNC